MPVCERNVKEIYILLLQIKYQPMKKVLLAALCSICFYGATAQDLNCKLEKGDIITDDGAYNSTVISVDEDGAGGSVMVRTLSTSRSDPFKDIIGYSFEHYDSAMKQINSFTYEVTETNGAMMGVIVKDGKITFVDFRFSKAKDKYVCTGNTASIADFKFTKKELFALSEDRVRQKMLSYTNDEEKFGKMFVSTDKASFGLSINALDSKGVDEVNKIYVYGTNVLDAKVASEFKADNNGKKFTISNFDISADGKSAYLLGIAMLDKKARKATGLRYQYQLTRITATGNTSHVFEPANDYPVVLKVVMKKDKLACIGLYMTKDADADLTGVCYYDLDAITLDVKNTKLNPFSAQFLQDKFGDKKHRDLEGYYEFRNVFLTPDNDIVFNAEQFYITYTQNFATKRYETYYHYDDIVSVKVNDNGELIWARNFNKQEDTRFYKRIYVSYSSIVNGSDTYFFFNAGDEPKKLDDTRVEFREKKKSKSSLYVVRINKEGNVNYKQLLNYEKEDPLFSTALGSPSKDGSSIYFSGGRGDRRQLLKISL